MKKTYLILFISCFIILSGCVNDVEEGEALPPLQAQEYGGVLRSSDSGKSFEARSLIDNGKTLARMNVLTLAFDPQNTRTVYAGTEKNGIYVTHNSGEIWELLDFAPRFTNAIAVNPEHTGTIYAGAVWDNRGRLFRSDDGGAQWNDIYVEPGEETNVTAVTLAPQDPQVIYIGTSKNDNGRATLARSDDGGKTWSNVHTVDDTIMSISFDANNSSVIYLYVRNDDVVRTRDGGVTWEELSELEGEREREEFYQGGLYSFVVHPTRSGVLYVGTDEGLYRSEDYGFKWTEEDIIGSTKGLPIRTLAIAPTGGGLLYVAGQAAYIRRDVKESWQITDIQSNRDAGTAMYDPRDARIIYMGLLNVE